MASFLFKNNSWSRCKSKQKIDLSFDKKLSECTTIPNVCRIYNSISCSKEYNQFITKIRDPSLKGQSISNKFIAASTFKQSPMLSESNFPSNFNSSESQLYLNNNEKTSLLICFGGNVKKGTILHSSMGIPLLTFHAKYSKIFGSIAYFNSGDYKNHKEFIKKIEAIYAIVPTNKNTVLIGVSLGGHLPIILKKELNAFASLSFSPIFSDVISKEYLDTITALETNYFNSAWSNKMKIYYSKKDDRDVEFARYCELKMSADTFKNTFHDLSEINPSHNTLATLFNEGILDQEMMALQSI